MYLQSRLRRQLIGLNPRISIYCDLINTKILFPDYEVLEPNIVGSWKSALGSFFYIWVNPVLIATPGTQIWLVQAFYILIQVLKRQTPCKNSSYSEKKKMLGHLYSLTQWETKLCLLQPLNSTAKLILFCVSDPPLSHLQIHPLLLTDYHIYWCL